MSTPVGNGRQTTNSSPTPGIIIRIRRGPDAPWKTLARSSSARSVALAKAAFAAASPDAERPARNLRIRVIIKTPLREMPANASNAAVNNSSARAKEVIEAADASLRQPLHISPDVPAILASLKALLEAQKPKDDAT